MWVAKASSMTCGSRAIELVSKLMNTHSDRDRAISAPSLSRVIKKWRVALLRLTFDR